MKNIARRSVRILSLVAITSFVACTNYTTQPLCTADNATTLPGISGSYVVSTQDEDFNVQSIEFNIDPNEDNNSQIKLAMRNRARGDNDTTEGVLCQLGGRTVLQVRDENGLGFTYASVSLTGTGLVYQPIAFDKAYLDTEGIPSRIVDMPENPDSTIRKLQGENGDKAFVISNESVPSTVVWKSAKLMPSALVLNRK